MGAVSELSRMASDYLQLAQGKSDKTSVARQKLENKLDELIVTNASKPDALMFFAKLKNCIQVYEKKHDSLSLESLKQMINLISTVAAITLAPSAAVAKPLRALIEGERKEKTMAEVPIDPKTINFLQTLEAAHTFLSLTKDPEILKGWDSTFRNWLSTLDGKLKSKGILDEYQAFSEALSTNPDLIEVARFNLRNVIKQTLEEDFKYETDTMFLTNFITKISEENGTWSVGAEDNREAWLNLGVMRSSPVYVDSSLNEMIIFLYDALFQRQLAINTRSIGGDTDNKMPYNDFVKLVGALADGIMPKVAEFQKIKEEREAADKKLKDEFDSLKGSLEPFESDSFLHRGMFDILDDEYRTFRKWLREHPEMVVVERSNCAPMSKPIFMNFGKEKGTNNYLIECKDEYLAGPHLILRLNEAQMAEFLTLHVPKKR